MQSIRAILIVFYMIFMLCTLSLVNLLTKQCASLSTVLAEDAIKAALNDYKVKQESLHKKQ